MMKIEKWRIVDGELLLDIRMENPDFSFEVGGEFLGNFGREVARLVKKSGIGFNRGTVKVFLHGALLTTLSLAPAPGVEKAATTSAVAGESIMTGDDGEEVIIELPTVEEEPGAAIEYRQMNLVLIAGHSGISADPGAVSGGRYESEYAKEFVTMLTNNLKKRSHLNINIILESSAGALADEMQFLKKSGGDYALSVHFNAGGGSGTEVIVPYRYSDLTIADGIINNFRTFNQPIRPTALYSRSSSGKTVRQNGVAVKNERDYYGIVRTGSDNNIHSDILEVEFIDNAANMKFYDNNKEKYVSAVADSIESHYLQNYLVS